MQHVCDAEMNTEARRGANALRRDLFFFLALREKNSKQKLFNSFSLLSLSQSRVSVFNSSTEGALRIFSKKNLAV